MNWARAKTILIILLVVLNVFLTYSLVQKNSGMEISEKELNGIKTLLEKNNIEIGFRLSNRNERAVRLNITNEAYDAEQFAKKVLKTDTFDKVENNDDIETGKHTDIFSYANSKVSISTNGKIIYTTLNNELWGQSLEKLEDYAYDFLDGFFDTKNYVMDYRNENEMQKQITFKYLYDKKYEIYNNYLTVILTKEGIFQVSGGFTTPTGYSSKAKTINYINSVVSLITLLDTNEKTELESISLGYYIEPVQNDGIVKSGEANPTWKLITDKGTWYFDAYTGEIVNK